MLGTATSYSWSVTEELKSSTVKLKMQSIDGSVYTVTNTFSIESALPTDMTAYYIFNGDFNDSVGTNHLQNNQCTLADHKVVIDIASARMLFTNSIGGTDITVTMVYTPSGSMTWRNLLGDAGSQCALFCSGNLLGYYNGSFVASTKTLVNGVRYFICMRKSGATETIHVDTLEVLNRVDSFDNNTYKIANLGGNQFTQSALGEIESVRVLDRLITSLEEAAIKNADM